MAAWRKDPEQNYGDDVLEGDIRISKKYIKERIARTLRELADLGDYVGELVWLPRALLSV